MKYEELCKDFSKRRPLGFPISRTAWFTARWDNPNESRNDVLRRHLKRHSIPYLNTVNGNVWFLFNGQWTRCEVEPVGNAVRFYMLEFEME